MSCGTTGAEHRVAIVDPDTNLPVAEDELGEVWFQGPSVARGYFEAPEASAETFGGATASANGDDDASWLRTGDLGFLHDGGLYIAGRRKDLIIVRGRNHYPQDIEQTVEDACASVRPGCVAAFSLDVNGEEELVVVAEIRDGDGTEQPGALTAQIRRAVNAAHEVSPYDVALIAARTIPKTSSGKIQRRACRAEYLGGGLSPFRHRSRVQRLFDETQSKLEVAIGANPALLQLRDQARRLQDRVRESVGPLDAERVAEFFERRRHRADSATDSAALPAVASGVGSARPTGREAGRAGRLSSEAAAVERMLVEHLAPHLRLAPSEVDVDTPFNFYGLDSRSIVGLSGEFETLLDRRLPPTLLYDYPTIRALAEHLAADVPRLVRPHARAVPFEPVAIIGIACRFPGADTPEAYWENLRGGRDCITEVPPDRWDVDRFYSEGSPTPGKMSTRWGGFLEDPALFDAAFFGIAPREAVDMDPQQRIALEVCWEALERADIAADAIEGSATGVFLGISSNDYGRLHFSNPAGYGLYASTGNALSIAANRISYALDLRGPSVAIDTACSASLVAIHHACRSLQQGECDLALAGGVNLILSPDVTVAFSQARMMAADGRCKTFDASADGYVRGEGCGILVLKRLTAAIDDGDRVIAVVRGSAVNQDGRSNGLTAPNGPSQEAVIRSALAASVLEPGDIDYVEAHGTGTPLGDPIELRALGNVFAGRDRDERPLWVGSTKTGIGHLEAAAGVAGVIKVALALERREIPPHLHFQEPNPRVPWDDVPIRVSADGRVAPMDARRPADDDLAALRARITEAESPDPFYERCVELGVEYGVGLAHTLTRLHRAPGELLAEVHLPSTAESAPGPLKLHPLVVVAWQQAYGAALGPEVERTMLPIRADRIVVLEQPGNLFWVHVRTSDAPEDAPPGAVRADFSVFARTGDLVGWLEGVTLAPAPTKRTALESLASVPPAERLDALVRYITGFASRGLRVAADDLDIDLPLTDLGLDSLVAVEIVLEIERELGVSINVTKLVEGMTIRGSAR